MFPAVFSLPVLCDEADNDTCISLHNHNAMLQRRMHATTVSAITGDTQTE